MGRDLLELGCRGGVCKLRAVGEGVLTKAWMVNYSWTCAKKLETGANRLMRFSRSFLLLLVFLSLDQWWSTRAICHHSSPRFWLCNFDVPFRLNTLRRQAAHKLFYSTQGIWHQFPYMDSNLNRPTPPHLQRYAAVVGARSGAAAAASFPSMVGMVALLASTPAPALA